MDHVLNQKRFYESVLAMKEMIIKMQERSQSVDKLSNELCDLMVKHPDRAEALEAYHKTLEKFILK